MNQDQNQYDFITNPEKPSKLNLLGSPNSKKQRIMLVVGGGFLLLLLISLAFSFISNLGKADRDQMLGLARQHSEIIRIAGIGEESAIGPDAKSLAATTRLALQSSQADLLEVVTKTGKVGDKELASGQNPQTDQRLTTARQNNRFDEEFSAVIREHLSAYKAALATAFEAIGNQTDRSILSDIYKQVDALEKPLLPETTAPESSGQ